MFVHNGVQVDEFWWADQTLRQRLLTDPAAVLKERGINVPAGLPARTVNEAVRVVSLLWVDGNIVPIDKFYIDPSDEGLLFGRGVWESTRTIDGVPWLWDLHIGRLRHTAELLGIDVRPDRLPDSDQVSEFVRTLTTQDVIVRLNVTAGRPGKWGVVWMSAALEPFPTSSIRLKSSRSPAAKEEPYSVWKTFQYAGRLHVGNQAFQSGYDSALMLDPEGNLLEAAHANVFVRTPDGWATPTTNGGLVLPGTVRQYLLERAPLAIREQVIPYSWLSRMCEAFVTNSNVGIVPVAQIDDHTFPVGRDTKDLMRWLPTGHARRT
jgi:branched-subunit amino acid aminotransferase/4-amino-4-deoxychorismate lyase